MELLTDAPVHHFVPDKYVFPPEKRPDLFPDDDSPSVAFPVIDMTPAALSDDRCCRLFVAEIIQAGKEFGFFQVGMHACTNDLFNFTRTCYLRSTIA